MYIFQCFSLPVKSLLFHECGPKVGGKMCVGKKKSSYDDYNLIALQGLDTDDLEGCEFHRSLEPKLLEVWNN